MVDSNFITNTCANWNCDFSFSRKYLLVFFASFVVSARGRLFISLKFKETKNFSHFRDTLASTKKGWSMLSSFWKKNNKVYVHDKRYAKVLSSRRHLFLHIPVCSHFHMFSWTCTCSLISLDRQCTLFFEIKIEIQINLNIGCDISLGDEKFWLKIKSLIYFYFFPIKTCHQLPLVHFYSLIIFIFLQHQKLHKLFVIATILGYLRWM